MGLGHVGDLQALDGMLAIPVEIPQVEHVLNIFNGIDVAVDIHIVIKSINSSNEFGILPHFHAPTLVNRTRFFFFNPVVDMNAIRRDEKVDFMHSVYVDQWDWEKVISEADRNLDYLKDTVKGIYKCIKEVNSLVAKEFKIKNYDLPDDIYFISTKELENLYPTLTRKERENKICSLYKAVFLYQIGWPLEDGASHDGRAADYDDWNLNGDILLWYDLYNIAFEISSMGIRVDKASLIKQLTQKNELNKVNNEYCRWIMDDKIPQSIGGGIGQSRLCMYMLGKAHIGEVQVSVWDKQEVEELKKQNIYLL